MTKRIVGLVLALCLVVGLLPLAAFADAGHTHTPTGEGVELTEQRVPAAMSAEGVYTEGKYIMQYTCAECSQSYTEEVPFGAAILHYLTSANEDATKKKTNFTAWSKAENTGTEYLPEIFMNPGDEAIYFATASNNATWTDNTYVEKLTDAAAIAAGNWQMKLEYPVLGTPVLTLKGANLVNNAGLWYGLAGYITSAPLKIVVAEDSTIKDNVTNADGTYTTMGALNLRTTGDVTITGPGKLTIGSYMYTSSHLLSIIDAQGNLTFDNANIDITKYDTLENETRNCSGITAQGGDITIKGGSVKIFGYTAYSPATYRGIKSGIAARKNATTGKGGNILITDGADVNITASLSGNNSSNPYGIYGVASITIRNSNVLVAHGGYAYGKAIGVGTGGTFTVDYTNGFTATGVSNQRFSYVDGVVTYADVKYPASAITYTDAAELTATVLKGYHFRIVANEPAPGPNPNPNPNPGDSSCTHVPAADDGDCTTAVLCTLCGGEVEAAKTHTYTDGTDTTCDNQNCNHVRFVGPRPDFRLSFATDGVVGQDGSVVDSNMTTAEGEATLTMKAGDPTKYYTTGQYSAIESLKNRYYMKETTDTTNWNVKVEYPADDVVTITLKDAKIVNKGGLQIGGYNAACEGPVKVVIEGNNEIYNYYYERGNLGFNTTGAGNDVTITGPGKLLLATNTNGTTQGAIRAKGNLILDNVDITILASERYGQAHGISVVGGNMTVKGGSLRICAYDNPNTYHDPSNTEQPQNYHLNQRAMQSAICVTKSADDQTKRGDLIIEGGANVYMAVSVTTAKDPSNRMVATDGKFTIKDSTVEMGLIGKCLDTAKLFSEKPTLEFANNAYTITATKTKKPAVTLTESSYDKYIKDVVMTPNLEKQVDWAETTSMGAITYFKVVPGGNGGNSTGTGTGSGSGSGSNPNTGDISILLTAAVSLSSAVGFAGITVLRKKKG